MEMGELNILPQNGTLCNADKYLVTMSNTSIHSTTSPLVFGDTVIMAFVK